MKPNRGRTRRALVGTALGAVLLVLLAAPGWALFGAIASAQGQVSTATLGPASNFQAAAACAGPNEAEAVLTWTASGSTFADGYLLERYRIRPNGQQDLESSVALGNVSTYTDVSLDFNRDYRWELTALASDWTSAMVEILATTPRRNECRQMNPVEAIELLPESETVTAPAR